MSANTYPHRDEPHYVYRCYDADDRLLYIGCTYNPPARMSQHAARSPWFLDVARVRFLVFSTRQEGLDKEARAIVTERPLHNVRRTLSVKAPTPIVESITTGRKRRPT